MKYTPFGETRYIDGALGTDRRYTGQREENGLGSLYDYNARFYSSVLGRFISADTIVPDGKNPQQFNRYTYVSNSPLNYTDPTGHRGCSTREECKEQGITPMGQPYESGALTIEERISVEREIRETRGNPAPISGSILPIAREDAVRIPPGGKYGDQRTTGKHPGVDISVIAGRPVRTPHDGIVVDVDVMPGVGFGQFVVIRHMLQDQIGYSVYAHMSRQGVQEGDIVLAGDQIGFSGNTGGVPPHLHYEYRKFNGFDVINDEFSGSYYPRSFAALDTSYVSPARLVQGINTAYGRSVENSSYRQWKTSRHFRRT
jgi:RHS repeat-associated protein